MSDLFDKEEERKWEARIVAMVLGEASDFEKDELERAIAEQPELGVFRERIETLHELLGEVGRSDEFQENEEWRLPEANREKLLAAIGDTNGIKSAQNLKKEEDEEEAKSKSKWRVPWLEIAAGLALLGIAAGLLFPGVSAPLSRARKEVADSQSYGDVGGNYSREGEYVFEEGEKIEPTKPGQLDVQGKSVISGIIDASGSETGSVRVGGEFQGDSATEVRTWAQLRINDSKGDQSIAKLGDVYGDIQVQAGRGISVGAGGEIDRESPNNTIAGATTELQSHGNSFALADNNAGVVRASGGVRRNGRVALRRDGTSLRFPGLQDSSQQSDVIQWDDSKASSGQGGHLFTRNFLGGADNLRGFDYRDIDTTYTSDKDLIAIGENLSGTLKFGAGMSSIDSVAGFLEIDEDAISFPTRNADINLLSSANILEQAGGRKQLPRVFGGGGTAGAPLGSEMGKPDPFGGTSLTKAQELLILRAQVKEAQENLNRHKEAIASVDDIERTRQQMAEVRTLIEQSELAATKRESLLAEAKEGNRTERLSEEYRELRRESSIRQFESAAKTLRSTRLPDRTAGKHLEPFAEEADRQDHVSSVEAEKQKLAAIRAQQKEIDDIIGKAFPDGNLSHPDDAKEVLSQLNEALASSLKKARRVDEELAKLVGIEGEPDPFGDEDTQGDRSQVRLRETRKNRAILPFEKLASTEPFSTFSLHVSDVSFQLAYSALTKGQFPDPARIRIEEFVNAFDYGDPLPAQSQRVAAAIEQAVHPTLQQRNLLRIALATAEAGRNAATPLHLTFLIDSSGSMERFDRQETLHRAFAGLASQLNAQDKVTLISFARRPRLVAEAMPGNESDTLVKRVENLPEEGGTNIESALKLAFEKAREMHAAGTQSRIILFTDGAANLGDANPERLSSLVEKMREAGIAFDAAGIGAEGLNDKILEALTRKGDGRYYLLDRPEDADEKFASQIAGALRPAAKNVKVQVEFNPLRVGRYRLLGFEKHRLKKEDFRNDKVDAAELSAAEAGVAVYQIEPLPEGRGEVGSVSVRFRDMDDGKMVEKRWPIPYQASLPVFEKSPESIRLAAIAALTASKLKGEPLGELIEWEQLGRILGNLSPGIQEQEEVKKLSEMVAKAAELEVRK